MKNSQTEQKIETVNYATTMRSKHRHTSTDGKIRQLDEVMSIRPVNYMDIVWPADLKPEFYELTKKNTERNEFF